MKIIKLGNPEITRQYSVPYTCDRCGCEFEAVAGDIKIVPAEMDPVKQIMNILDDVKTEKLFKVNCPGCGKILSKTTAEVDACGKERVRANDES